MQLLQNYIYLKLTSFLVYSKHVKTTDESAWNADHAQVDIDGSEYNFIYM